jgi:hypothetical protein
LGFEEVVMLESRKTPSNHRIAEVMRPVVPRDPGRMTMQHPEVPTLPSDFLTQTDHSRRPATNCAFSRMLHRPQM